MGLTGLVVHLMVLATSRGFGAPFWLGQSAAILMAMSWNFMLNNGLTFRDQRLRGGAVWQGLLSFYVACLGGAAVSEVAGAALHGLGVPWFGRVRRVRFSGPSGTMAPYGDSPGGRSRRPSAPGR